MPGETMTRWIILIGLLLPAASLFAQEDPGIRVTLKNTSRYKQTIQVRDDLCPAPKAVECTLAEALVKSDECRRQSSLEQCRQARQLLKTGCVTGVNHTLALEPGQAQTIGICSNDRGQGKISTRRLSSRVWTRHFWLQNGKTITIP